MPPRQTPRKKTRRLAAFMAAAGVASRRKSEDLIRQGRVTVDGRTVLEPALDVEPGKSRVAIDGEVLRLPATASYYILNKPRGFLSACSDGRGRPTVVSLMGRDAARLFPVGRLDFNAEGLVLMTDDGAAANRLTHPRFGVPRTYLVKVQGQPRREDLDALVRGVREGGEKLRAHAAALVRKTSVNAWVEVVLTEGKNREVRRLFDAVGYFVMRIIRVAFGPLKLGRLAPGEARRLTPAEEKLLQEFLERRG